MNKSKTPGRPFAQLDLNLLKIFNVIAQERKTITAAKRLNMTQPAVSRALGKLRDHFNDELFVRTRHGLKPTSKGQFLTDRLPEMLDDLEQLFRELEAFNPLSHQTELKIAINGFLGVSLSAKLFFHLKELAPNIKLSIESWGAMTMTKLLNGELDLGINYRIDDYPKELIQKQIGRDPFQFWVRNDHPLTGQTVDYKDLAAYPLMSPILPDWNEKMPRVSQFFSKQGFDLEVLFRAESIPSAIEVVGATDAFLPTSYFLAKHHTPKLEKLKMSDNFIQDLTPLTPSIDSYMHYRNRQNPMFKWLLPIIEQMLQLDEEQLT